MCLSDALALQDACHECTSERIASTHCVCHFHLRCLYKRNFARGEHITAVYAAGKDEHLQIILAQEKPAFILQVDARITEDAAYGNQFFIVDFEDIASLDAIGDNFLIIESLTEIDVEDFEDFFSLRHVVEEAIDGVAGNLVALSQRTEAGCGTILCQLFQGWRVGDVVPGCSLLDVVARNAVGIERNLDGACRLGYLVYLIVEMVVVEFLLQFLAQLIIAHCADRTALESEL